MNDNQRRQSRSSQSVLSPSPSKALQQNATRRVLYHGVHPGSATGDESSVDEIEAYLQAVETDQVGFVYFSQELDQAWLDGKAELFPRTQIDKIRQLGAIPFIRLMTRTTTETNQDQNKEKIYSYEVILNEPTTPAEQSIAKKFHDRMFAWGMEAARDSLPLYVEWGTEANGDWFWWNARWYCEARCSRESNKKSKEQCLAKLCPDGTAKFRTAFQRLHDLINDEARATNVKWIFHVAASSSPDPSDNVLDDWNSLANYYPEKDTNKNYVDAIGVSVYGAQKKDDRCSRAEDSFVAQLDQLLDVKNTGRDESDTLKSIGRKKDIFVLEFGETLIVNKGDKHDSNCNAAKWAKEALEAMFNINQNRWEEFNLVGFSWWNEAWVDKTDGITDMRVQSFDLCRALGSGEEKKIVEKRMGCDCWTTNQTKQCDNLSLKRANLRTTFSIFFKTHEKLLRKVPADFLRHPN